MALLAAAELLFVRAIVASSRRLHSCMLAALLRNRLSFFDATPVGRLLNRFSKDVEAVEEAIPANYQLCARMLFTLLATFATISAAYPLFLLPLLPISALYVFVLRYYVTGNSPTPHSGPQLL